MTEGMVEIVRAALPRDWSAGGGGDLRAWQRAAHLDQRDDGTSGEEDGQQIDGQGA